MSGGILQLVTKGIETIYLTENPQITMFKLVYRRHTNFSMSDNISRIKSITRFGNKAEYKLDRLGDCIHKLYIIFDIPEILLKFDNPTISKIASILLENGIIWDYIGDGLTANEFITITIYENNIKTIIYDKIIELIEEYNINVEHLKDTKEEFKEITEGLTTLNTSIIILINESEDDVIAIIEDLETLIDTIETNIIFDNLEEIVNRVKDKITNDTDNEITYMLFNIKSVLMTLEEFPENIYIRINTINTMLSTIREDINNLPLTDSGAILIDLGDIEELFNILETSMTFILNALITTNEIIISEKQRNLSLNNEYITQLFSKLIDNLTNTVIQTKTKILYEGLNAYKNDIISYNPDMNIKVYNAGGIKNIMYNKYLNLIVKSFDNVNEYTYTTESITDIFDPEAIIGEDNFTRLYDNVIFYHVIEFGKYNVLPNLIGTSTQNYIDNVLINGYISTSNESIYMTLDTYKIYIKFIGTLVTVLQTLESTNNLILVKQNLLENIIWNIRINYQQLINILKFLGNSNYNEETHYRFGYYKKYTKNGTIIEGSTSVFNTIVESKTPELNDNIFSVLQLLQLSGEPSSINRFYSDKIISEIRTTTTTIQDSIETTIYEEYFNNFDLWKRVIIDNSPMKTILDNSVTVLYNQLTNFYTYFASLNDSGKKRMAIMNYIPIITIRDIASMLYDILNETTINITNNTNTSEELTIFLRDYYDYRDIDQRGIDPGAIGADDFKRELYSDILEAVAFYDTGTTYKLIDKIYLQTVSATYASTSNEYIVLSIFRPEGVLTFESFTDILPIKTIVERYRTRLKSTINDFITLYDIDNIDNIGYDTIVDVFDNVVNSFIKENIPLYSAYVNNGYSYYKIDTTITSSIITTPRYCDAIASIWYRINKSMIRQYNDMFNNCLLSRIYYTDELGPTMLENFNKFKKLVTEGPYFVEYYDEENEFISTVYSSTDRPVSEEGFNFYLLRPVNNTPYNITKINVEHMIIHFEKDLNQYNVLKNILNIKTIDINRRLLQYNTVVNITENISDNMSEFADSTGDPPHATEIINDTKIFVNETYKGVMDIIFGNYSPILEKSITGIIGIGMTGLNPYTSIKEVTTNLTLNRLNNISNWWETNTTNIDYTSYFTGLPNLYDLIITILSSITSTILFTDKNIKNIYNNYETTLDILNYVMNKVINSTDVKFIINTLETTTIESVKTKITNILIKEITEREIIINNITKVGDTEIELNYDYPLYKFDDARIIEDDGEGPFNITYNGSELDIQIIKLIKNEQPQYAWVKELGHKIIKKISVEVDSIVYDEYTSELLHLDYEINKDNNHKRGYDIMIGNTEDMYTISSEYRPKRRIYVPLNFWFCRDIGNSIPMINILYSDIRINIETSELDELLYVDIGSQYIKKPIINAYMMTQYIYLDNEERNKMANMKREYIIDRYNYGGRHVYEYKDIKEDIIKTRLYFKYSCKYIIWTSKVKTRIKEEKDKIDWIYNGYRIKDDKGELTKKIRSIDKIKIQFNGRDRETYKEEGYYNRVQPYGHKMGSIEYGEYIYSFALQPLILQPSGTVNLGQIAELDIISEYTDIELAITKIREENLIIEKEYWARTCQIIRIMSGFMAQAFIY